MRKISDVRLLFSVEYNLSGSPMSRRKKRVEDIEFSAKPFFYVNLSKEPHPPLSRNRNYFSELFPAIVGVDRRPIDVDPFPEFSSALDRGGWPEGIRHIKGKIRRR